MNTELRQLLQKEIPILEANIRALYADLDKKYHLSGANIPITFGFDTDVLGSYTRAGMGEEEHFHFSLLFIDCITIGVVSLSKVKIKSENNKKRPIAIAIDLWF